MTTRTHRWSKLQTALYRVIDHGTGFRIHCCAYRIGVSLPLPRYWITIGKQIVWDFPKNFMGVEGDWYFYDETKALSRLIRQYIECPRDELLTMEFDDRWGMLPYIKACDKRIGKRRLRTMLADPKYNAVKHIITQRLEKQ